MGECQAFLDPSRQRMGYAHGVEDFNVLKNFQYDICDQAKMVKAINRES